jgi:hypothetical protein
MFSTRLAIVDLPAPDNPVSHSTHGVWLSAVERAAQHHRLLGLGGHLAHDVDALGLEAIQVTKSINLVRHARRYAPTRTWPASFPLGWG